MYGTRNNRKFKQKNGIVARILGELPTGLQKPFLGAHGSLWEPFGEIIKL